MGSVCATLDARSVCFNWDELPGSKDLARLRAEEESLKLGEGARVTRCGTSIGNRRGDGGRTGNAPRCLPIASKQVSGGALVTSPEKKALIVFGWVAPIPVAMLVK